MPRRPAPPIAPPVTPPGPGRIVQLATSRGGVPKLPVPEAHIGRLGLEGDAQKHTKIHGGPDRAVCLYALEVITALQAEGHSIYPGAAGENVTVAGVPWAAVVAGARLALGEAVVVEVTRATEPCRQIAGCFADRGFRRIDEARHPGWSRVYARVLREGRVRVGEPVVLLGA